MRDFLTVGSGQFHDLPEVAGVPECVLILLGELVALKLLVELRLPVDEVRNDLYIAGGIGTKRQTCVNLELRRRMSG